MSAKIYIEGGGDSKELHIRCRQAFRQLLAKCGFEGRMPRLIACGGRDATFEDFKTAHRNNPQNIYIALLVDSEDPVANIEETWTHLNVRDKWAKPDGAGDEQALLMTTCMETWIVTDRTALRTHYQKLEENSLPPLNNMEARNRHEIQAALAKATKSCKNAYEKGKRSFEVVAHLTPDELRKHLPSFERLERVLDAKL